MAHSEAATMVVGVAIADLDKDKDWVVGVAIADFDATNYGKRVRVTKTARRRGHVHEHSALA